MKFDGYRIQDDSPFGKNGDGFTCRFATITAAVLALPTSACIIDDELIAGGDRGQPDFLALLRDRAPACVYAMTGRLQGKDVRGLPLKVRREMLRNCSRSKTEAVPG